VNYERKRFMFDFLADATEVVGGGRVEHLGVQALVGRLEGRRDARVLDRAAARVRYLPDLGLYLGPVYDEGFYDELYSIGEVYRDNSAGVYTFTVAVWYLGVITTFTGTMQPLMPAPLAEPGEITIPAPGRRQRGGYTRGLVRRLRGLAP